MHNYDDVAHDDDDGDHNDQDDNYDQDDHNDQDDQAVLINKKPPSSASGEAWTTNALSRPAPRMQLSRNSG